MIYLTASPWPVLPNTDQAHTIGQLRRLAGLKVTIDATPVDEPAVVRCNQGWTHGLGLIRTAEDDLLCVRCAARALRAPEWVTSARVRVEILRDVTPPRWQQEPTEATG